MDIRTQILEPDCFYHIFNRGINGCKIFSEDRNYHFFLKKFMYFTEPVIDVYAYCLMPNHFHFVIKVKSKEELEHFFSTQPNGNKEKIGLHNKEMIVSKQLGKFISSYSQAYNKVTSRHGSLLESPFKRKKIDTETYLKNVIIYTHLNATDLGENLDNYSYSSYNSFLSEQPTSLKRNEVIAYFGDKDNFAYCHKYHSKLNVEI